MKQRISLVLLYCSSSYAGGQFCQNLGNQDSYKLDFFLLPYIYYLSFSLFFFQALKKVEDKICRFSAGCYQNQTSVSSPHFLLQRTARSFRVEFNVLLKRAKRFSNVAKPRGGVNPVVKFRQIFLPENYFREASRNSTTGSRVFV